MWTGDQVAGASLFTDDIKFYVFIVSFSGLSFIIQIKHLILFEGL